MAFQKLLSLVFSQLVLTLLFLDLSNSQGLQLGFYRKTCPNAEYIVHDIAYKYISRDPTLAAPLLRMHFHDCFVRGCDGSVLLDSTKKNQAEKAAIPNQTLRGFNVIDAIKFELERRCPGIVSCADILALAARDSVLMIGGPSWSVPTGRRDGRVSISSEALNQLPSPFANINQLKQNFASKGLSVKDLVVLSGGHTIGIGHCFIISNRLYNFTGKGDTDPSLDPLYAAQLKKKCKPGNSNTIVEMDPGSFKTFDEDYYTVVAKRRGLFQSDAALLNDIETSTYVKLQALTNGITFAQDFANSMVKMGHIGVLTGNQGEIRKQCAFVNY
ncbi:peroxidase 27 [Ricinus communis]|uniref:Peroxidase n=1 Tax=Ricinus communis TaxID=3988 RepID=B9SMM0_RICCO|nr:peroxidase 27 [Ricinus communis]EEF35165.1 Peroxidase 27 precursor, putative [Ricinus communis]|eukprot:XP_002527239.1 peroxidase 27 [Ricinus communis]